MERTARELWKLAYDIRPHEQMGPLQTEGVIRINAEVLCLDSTSIKAHSDGTGAIKKASKLLKGHAVDSPEGMNLLFFTPAGDCEQSLLMDRAYEGEKMRATTIELGCFWPLRPSENRSA